MKNAKELALLAARALSDKKGKEIQVLEIGELTTLADYFVIATGSGRAIAAAPGCCWTTAASLSTSLTPRPVSSTGWSACGVTVRRWI